MMNHGDSTVHFTKMKPMELAEIRSVLQKRPHTKFSVGLSPEARQAMAQVAEEEKIQQAARRGKRGSKCSVLFADTVRVHAETPRGGGAGSGAGSDSGGHAPYNDFTYSIHFSELLGNEEPDEFAKPRSGRRRGSITRWLEKRAAHEVMTSPQEVHEVDVVDVVTSANVISDSEDEEEEDEDFEMEEEERRYTKGKQRHA